MTDGQNTAGGDARRGGHGVALSMAALLGAVLVVMLVLPGFLAAGFSRSGPYPLSINGSGWEEDYYDGPSARSAWTRVERVLLAPSAWLMKHSEPIHRFYMWQYHAAGGFDLDITG